ncbi:hypothetical protein B0T21DRAFT_359456 [Apiosordaria backusii]|uniref:Uncharacterized protein n=1 Tax=Apiosordaria backusii TaxID=314023 RepID=A0AA40K477_9PEZI|nr:hypothetical protein B0T21DRAFT_359456 [Apiosordaria backusii]
MFLFKTKAEARREAQQKLDSIHNKLDDIDYKLTTINNHLNNLESVRHELEAHPPPNLYNWPNNLHVAQPMPSPPVPHAGTRTAPEQDPNATELRRHEGNVGGEEARGVELAVAQPVPSVEVGARINVFLVVFACLCLLLSLLFR